MLQLKNGLLDKNPILIQLLGTCPTLAVTTSFANALGMGVAVTAVLMISNLFISLLRKKIPPQVRIASYVLLICGFVNAVELLIKAYLPELDRALGVFIPLIAVNCIILARAEAFASKNGPLPSVVDGLSMGLGFTAALALLGTIREILGAGSFNGINIFGEGIKPVPLLIMPPGAFITLGCMIAVVQKLMSIKSRGGGRKRDMVYAESEMTPERSAAAKLMADADQDSPTGLYTAAQNVPAQDEPTAQGQPTDIDTAAQDEPAQGQPTDTDSTAQNEPEQGEPAQQDVGATKGEIVPPNNQNNRGEG